MKHIKGLAGQVLIALILGIIVGILYPAFGESLKPLGDGFIKLIKMIIAPIVFCVVVTGICGAGNLKKVGRVGVKSVLYFEIITTFALAVGIALAFIFQPGTGMNIDPKLLHTESLGSYLENVSKVTNTTDFLLRMIPTSVVDAFAKGDVLQVMLFSILFGVSLSMIGEKAQPVVRLIDQIAAAFFGVMSLIVRLAPVGVFGAIAFTTAKYGVGSLQKLGMLLVIFYLSCFVFVIGVLGVVLKLAGFNVFKLIRYFRDELLIVLGTASSDSVLPQVMVKLERLSISKGTVGLVIPTGYSFNLDGFSIYLTLAAIFIAQATNTHISFTELLTILGVAMITSKGAAGIPGSAIVVLAATLSAIPSIPVAGLTLVLGVDWFMGIGRALTNMVGNCVATVVIAVWEGDIDRQQARRVLAEA
ncbi:MAG: C4-dicarboxylate transporter DctA [Pseudomonadota bacterium]